MATHQTVETYAVSLSFGVVSIVTGGYNNCKKQRCELLRYTYMYISGVTGDSLTTFLASLGEIYNIKL